MYTFGPRLSPSLRRCAGLIPLAILAGAASAAAEEVSLSAGCRLSRGPAHAVVHVLDGETVRLDDGSEARLINILAPRASDVGARKDDWPLQEEARQALAKLVQGQTVVLAFDGNHRLDRYRRWLAHLVVEKDGTREWVQTSLVAQGMARVHSTAEHSGCTADLLASEKAARDGGIGLWANAAYRVRSAARAAELLPYRHTYQLVSGYIRRVSRRRGTITYLNFGHGRSDFSVVLRAKADILQGIDPLSLRGRTILVRGWIDQRSGPLIEVDSAHQLEVTPDRRPMRSKAAQRDP
jgi:endonuclease YncB( thermonuclease family)